MNNEDFDILELIMTLIQDELNLPCFYLFCEEDLFQPYVIFKINDNKDIDKFDNGYISEFYSVEITLWFTNAKDTLLYRTIKNKLIENGFRFDRSYDLLDETSNKTAETVRYYGKLMEFRYKRFY